MRHASAKNLIIGLSLTSCIALSALSFSACRGVTTDATQTDAPDEQTSSVAEPLVSGAQPSGYFSRKIGVFRNGGWALDIDGDGAWNNAIDAWIPSFGQAGDQPVVGRWTATQPSDCIGVYRPADKKFYLDANCNGVWEPGTDLTVSYASQSLVGAQAIVGEFNANNSVSELGFAVPSGGALSWKVDSNMDGTFERSGVFGLDTDRPFVLPSAAGTSTIATKRGSSIYVDSDGSFLWSGGDSTWSWRPDLGDFPLAFVRSGNQVLLGSYYPRDTPSWYLDANNSHALDPLDSTNAFGLPGDVPVTGSWTVPSLGVERQLPQTLGGFFENSSVSRPPGPTCASGSSVFMGPLGFTSGNAGTGPLTENNRASVAAGTFCWGGDNRAFRLKEGDMVLLAQGVMATDTAGYVAADPLWTFPRVGLQMWKATNCGTSPADWSPWKSIDPTLAVDPAEMTSPGLFGSPQWENSYYRSGGFDHSQPYVDPWSGDVYVTVNARGTKGQYSNTPNLPVANSNFLFRFKRTASTPPSYSAATQMHTSTLGQYRFLEMSSTASGRLALVSIDGPNGSGGAGDFRMGLRWRDPNGTIVGPVVASTDRPIAWAGVDYGFGGNKFSNLPHGSWGVALGWLGGWGVSRVGTSTHGSRAVDTFRVLSPVVIAGRFGLNLDVVSIDGERGTPQPSDGKPPRLVRHFESANGAILHATMIETDRVGMPANAPDSWNDALIYWVETSQTGPTVPAGGVGSAADWGNLSVKGVIAHGEGIASEVFTISSSVNFPLINMGDYIRGSYFYDPAKGTSNFVVHWIEPGVINSLHTRTVSIVPH